MPVLHPEDKVKRLSDDEIPKFIIDAKQFGIKAHKVIHSSIGVHITDSEDGYNSLGALLLAHPEYGTDNGTIWAVRNKEWQHSYKTPSKIERISHRISRLIEDISIFIRDIINIIKR